jgi:ADP-ribosylglycohydrolase
VTTFLSESILGCLIGGAIGDAIGSAEEGCQIVPPFADLLSQPWNITDDTQLTLATCEAISAVQAVDPETIAAAMLRWYRRGLLTGLGSSTLKALHDLEAGIHWALAGRQGERAAGNGAAMRIAPLAFLLDASLPESRRTIRDVCRITHHSDEAYAGALAVILEIQGLPLSQLPDTNVRDRILDYESLAATTTIAEAAARFGSSGYVVESVPLAIFAARRVDQLGFAGMLEQVVSAGGDTDTNASIAGQLAGVRLGLNGPPAHLVDRLPSIDGLLSIARRFAESVHPTQTR